MAPEQGEAPRRGTTTWHGVSAKQRILWPPSSRLNQPELLHQVAVESATVELIGTHSRHTRHRGRRTRLRLELSAASAGLLDSRLLDSGTQASGLRGCGHSCRWRGWKTGPSGAWLRCGKATSTACPCCRAPRLRQPAREASSIQIGGRPTTAIARPHRGSASPRPTRNDPGAFSRHSAISP